MSRSRCLSTLLGVGCLLLGAGAPALATTVAPELPQLAAKEKAFAIKGGSHLLGPELPASLTGKVVVVEQWGFG